MKLADYLASHDISRHEFARRIGVHPETVRLWLIDPEQPVPQKRFLRRIIEETDGKVTAFDFIKSEFADARAAE